MSNFGEELKKLRLSKKLSLKEVGRRGGISHSYISQIENSNRNPPKPDIIKKLSEGLNVDYYELLESAGYLDSATAKQNRNLDTLRAMSQDGALTQPVNNQDLYEWLVTDTDIYYKGMKLSNEDKKYILEVLERSFSKG